MLHIAYAWARLVAPNELEFRKAEALHRFIRDQCFLVFHFDSDRITLQESNKQKLHPIILFLPPPYHNRLERTLSTSRPLE